LLITRATFEEHIDAMMGSKRELAEMTLSRGEAWVGQLPTQVMWRLFASG
jgi:SNF2 family DNA or RNA helicase